MNKRRVKLVKSFLVFDIVILGLVLLLLPKYIHNGKIDEDIPVSEMVVTRVIDGDTLVVESGERVRLFSIDTPEKDEECFEEARQVLRGLVLNKKIRLEAGEPNKDRFGRLLRWVFVGEENINLEMVRRGLARVYIFDESRFKEELKLAEENAKEEGIGCLWGKYGG